MSKYFEVWILVHSVDVCFALVQCLRQQLIATYIEENQKLHFMQDQSRSQEGWFLHVVTHSGRAQTVHLMPEPNN